RLEPARHLDPADRDRVVDDVRRIGPRLGDEVVRPRLEGGARPREAAAHPVRVRPEPPRLLEERRDALREEQVVLRAEYDAELPRRAELGPLDGAVPGRVARLAGGDDVARSELAAAD